MTGIRQYTINDEAALFDLLVSEGDDWKCYFEDAARRDYAAVLLESLTYIALTEQEITGYIRCRKDGAFDVYVYDLLVGKAHRGQNIGKSLTAHVADLFPDSDVYLLSGTDADGYYAKQGYDDIGTIFQFRR